MIVAIDPGNEQSAYVWLDSELRPVRAGIEENHEVVYMLQSELEWDSTMVIEMVSSYGMPVGESVFETVFWIGRFWQAAEDAGKRAKIYRKDVKMNLCQSMRAKDSNIRQALIDRFGVVGTKKKQGWFYGFKKDMWAAYAVGVTYHDMIQNLIEEGKE